jgi:hypothetical protein
MSQLFVVTRPALVPGFQLAGVDAHGVEDVESAQELIEKWMTAVKWVCWQLIMATRMDAAFMRRLVFRESAYLAILQDSLRPEASAKTPHAA